MRFKTSSLRHARLLCAVASILGAAAATVASDQAPAKPQTQPVEQIKPINAVAELDGAWSGEDDGVKVQMHVDRTRVPFAANWFVIYTVPVVVPAPEEASTREVRKGTELRPVAKDGRVELYLPAYLGKNPAIKQSAWNGKKPVGEIVRLGNGSIRLRIIPAGYQDPAAAEDDFPSVRGLVLRKLDNDGPKRR